MEVEDESNEEVVTVVEGNVKVERVVEADCNNARTGRGRRR